MKKIFFTIIMSFTIFSFSQNNYTFKNGGSILQDGKKITPDEVRGLLTKNPKALVVYNAGKTKKTIGNLLFIADWEL